MTKSPKQRLGYGAQGFEQLKSHAWFQGLDWNELENKTAVPPFIPNVTLFFYLLIYLHSNFFFLYVEQTIQFRRCS